MGRRYKKIKEAPFADSSNNEYGTVVFNNYFSTSINIPTSTKLSRSEYLDRKNILTVIAKCYHGYREEYNCTGDYFESFEGNMYFIDVYPPNITCYFNNCYYCNRQCKCGSNHPIDTKHHRYNFKTGVWEHIKRLPNIPSLTAFYFTDPELQAIHYVLDNKFFWRRQYIDGVLTIKFYPNLDHYDHIHTLLRVLRIRFRSICKEIERNSIHDLFYRFYDLPMELQEKITDFL